MQVLTVGIFRKAALVKRQTLCGGEYWELDSSPASGPGGVWALCAVLGFQSALSPWWWPCSVQVLLEQQR